MVHRWIPWGDCHPGRRRIDAAATTNGSALGVVGRCEERDKSSVDPPLVSALPPSVLPRLDPGGQVNEALVPLGSPEAWLVGEEFPGWPLADAVRWAESMLSRARLQLGLTAHASNPDFPHD